MTAKPIMPQFGPEHPVNQLPPDTLTLASSQFAAKLTETERCQILALRMVGMSIGALAVTFGVNRRTVTHICNQDSTRYRNVRELADRVGHEAFIHRYVTDDLVQRVKANHSEESVGYAERDQHPGAAVVGNANKMARKYQGVRIHKSTNLPHSHRIEVGWVEGLEGYPNGWYAKLLDVSDDLKGEWIGDTDALTHYTSQSAFTYACNYLEENYVQ